MSNLAEQRAQGEVPRIEAAATAGDSSDAGIGDCGYFQLSHSIFRDPELRALSGDTFRLFLWLSCQAWRFRDSDGRLRASVSFITEGCGMPHATVSRGLRILRDERLIELIETDFKRGNLWRVAQRAVWRPRAVGFQRVEVAQIEVPPTEAEALSKRGTSGLKLSQEPPQIEAETRTPIPFKKSISPLSTENPEIRSYLESVSPVGKRESEQKAYEKLRGDYDEDQIAHCLKFLLAKGIPISGVPCHSPMRFLAKAMGQVWA